MALRLASRWRDQRDGWEGRRRFRFSQDCGAGKVDASIRWSSRCLWSLGTAPSMHQFSRPRKRLNPSRLSPERCNDGAPQISGSDGFRQTHPLFLPIVKNQNDHLSRFDGSRTRCGYRVPTRTEPAMESDWWGQKRLGRGFALPDDLAGVVRSRRGNASDERYCHRNVQDDKDAVQSAST